MNCPHCNKPVTLALLAGGAAAVPPPAAAALASPTGTCPDHGAAWVHRSGISQRTGNAYDFWACPERGCKWTSDKVGRG